MDDGNENNVISLPARDNMTVEECLSLTLREHGDYESVLVIAGARSGDLVIRSSGMSRKDALWMTVCAIENALGK